MSKMLTMVARYVTGEKNETAGVLVLDENYKVIKLNTQKAMEFAMNDLISNLSVKNGELIGGNGSLKRYTSIDVHTNAIIGVPRSVVLSRLEDDKNGNLTGYIIYGANNVVAQVDVDTAVKLVQNDSLVNGKLRTTSKGLIVSSINGEYPTTPVLSQTKVADTSVEVDIVMFREAANEKLNAEPVRSATIGLSYANALALKAEYPKLKEAASRLGAKLSIMGVDPEIAEVKAVGSTVYVEIPFDSYLNIVARDNVKVSNANGSVVVCSRNASEESAVKVENGKMTVLGTGDEETQANIKAYIAKVVDHLKKITK